MSNFTPDDIFRAAFSTNNKMVPNESMWNKLQAQLVETAEANKQKKRNNRIAVAACLLLISLGAGGYLSLNNKNQVFNNVIANNNIAKVNVNVKSKSNNVPEVNNQTNNLIQALSSNTNNYTLINNINNNTIIETENSEDIVLEDIATTKLSQALVLNKETETKPLNENTANLTNKINPSISKNIELPKNTKGHVSKGLFVGGGFVKGYDNKLGHAVYFQHQKHISPQFALTGGAGIVNLPTTYKYKKVAYKEGLPTELDAKLYQLNLIYAQIGITYYPQILNKQKPNFAINAFAMPGLITNVDATTNAGSSEIDNRMKRQINKMHFLAGVSISKSITPRLWLDAGVTGSISTLTNGVFLNKTNAVNNIIYTQIGLKYKIK